MLLLPLLPPLLLLLILQTEARCVPGCKTDKEYCHTQSAKCVNIACETSSDCVDAVCINGACFPNQPCHNNEQCPSTITTCTNEKCVPKVVKIRYTSAASSSDVDDGGRFVWTFLILYAVVAVICIAGYLLLCR